MAILVIPKVTILEPKKSKRGYFASIEKKNTDLIKIRARTSDGKSRGEVGCILKDGTINASDEVKRYINSEVFRKIDFLLDIAFGSKRSNTCILESGLIRGGRL